MLYASSLVRTTPGVRIPAARTLYWCLQSANCCGTHGDSRVRGINQRCLQLPQTPPSVTTQVPCCGGDSTSANTGGQGGDVTTLLTPHVASSKPTWYSAGDNVSRPSTICGYLTRWSPVSPTICRAQASHSPHLTTAHIVYQEKQGRAHAHGAHTCFACLYTVGSTIHLQLDEFVVDAPKDESTHKPAATWHANKRRGILHYVPKASMEG